MVSGRVTVIYNNNRYQISYNDYNRIAILKQSLAVNGIIIMFIVGTN